MVTETSNSVLDTKVWDVVVPQSALSWQRVLVANWLSSNGEQWAHWIKQHNSGESKGCVDSDGVHFWCLGLATSSLCGHCTCVVCVMPIPHMLACATCHKLRLAEFEHTSPSPFVFVFVHRDIQQSVHCG